ncbi:MAG: 50S ribosomal protein L31 [Candidatus Magasanikbacteria bacterium]|nr:50S ribosomal protein L31 [Candidatus Magasanikbacteria bacterium]
MKKDLHPPYYPDAKVACACGATFTTGSTLKEIRVEICSQCHPFYTGKQKFVDTARRVEKFQERAAKVSAAAAVRKGRKVKKAAATARREAKRQEAQEAAAATKAAAKREVKTKERAAPKQKTETPAATPPTATEQ